MEVFSFEPAETVAEKSIAKARAREAAAAQALRDLMKKSPAADPMEVDEQEERVWGGMDMVREGSGEEGSGEDEGMWLGTPMREGSRGSGGSGR